MSSCVFPAWGQGACGVGPVGQPLTGQQGQSCRQQPGFFGARGCCYVVTLVEASPVGAGSVRSSNQPVIMAGSSNGEGAGGPDDEILKDEYFFT